MSRFRYVVFRAVHPLSPMLFGSITNPPDRGGSWSGAGYSTIAIA
jgi:hypothetical protein